MDHLQNPSGLKRPNTRNHAGRVRIRRRERQSQLPGVAAFQSRHHFDHRTRAGRVIYTIVGGLIVAIILLEAFETIILPRRVTRRFRLTRLFYVSTWRPWRAIARLMRVKPRETFISFYGPLSLLVLFAVWATLLIFGFGFMYFSAARYDPTHPALQTCFYLSGTTFFTLGLGDVTPHTSGERVMAVFESGLGFGFLALIISYLPVIYQAFSRREVSIVLLDARAGSPPTASELLQRHGGPHGLQAIQVLFQDWER